MADLSFLGRGWSFPPRFHSSGIEMSDSDKDIRESLIVLLSTHPGERLMNPHYGCGIKTYAYRTINTTTMTQLKDTIARAILFYEPRVRVESIDIKSDNEKNGKLDIQVSYTVHATNTRHNIVFPYYLTEGTDVAIKG